MYECPWCGHHFERPDSLTHDTEKGTCPNCKTQIQLKENTLEEKE